MSLNISGPITVPLLICMLECLRGQKSCQGSLIFSFATQKSAFGRNQGSLCGLSHVSTLPGLTLLPAINHLTIMLPVVGLAVSGRILTLDCGFRIRFYFLFLSEQSQRHHHLPIFKIGRSLCLASSIVGKLHSHV